MNIQSVYKLALQAQLAASVRELMRLELEEDPHANAICIEVETDGHIDVRVLNDSRMDMFGYSL